MMRHTSRFAALALVTFGGLTSMAVDRGAKSASESKSIQVMLKPVRDTGGGIVALDVTLRFADATTNDRFALRAPLTVYSFSGVAERLRDLRMTDAGGQIAVTVSTETGHRVWRPDRPVLWPLVVNYRAIVPQSRLTAGPPIDLRTFAGGLTFGGQGFLALPNDSLPYRIRLGWDLDAFAAGAIGVSSLGEGRVDTVAPLSVLTRSFYLAGPVSRYPERGDVSGFSAFWLGEKDSVDTRAEMAWAATAYARLKTFFHDSTRRQYRFFTRVLPEPSTSGGTASINSFMLQVPKPTRSNDPAEVHSLPRGVIIHEMIHGWVGGVSCRTNTQWFGEGATTFFTTRTALKLALLPVEAAARDYTGLSGDYYPNPYRNVSADSAADAFWFSKAGERLPYARGALYMMSLNARIQKASARRRSLEDMMFDLFAQRAREGSLSTDAFVRALTTELGPGAAAEFDSVIVRGSETISLPPDAFGPCFSRQTIRVVVPDFTFRRNESARRIVTSLRSESAAFQAGLRDGDEVTNQVDLGDIEKNPSEPIVLEIRRGEQARTIRYLPHSLAVESYEWTRVPRVPEEVCRQG
jgi:hypothetical protein